MRAAELYKWTSGSTSQNKDFLIRPPTLTAEEKKNYRPQLRETNSARRGRRKPCAHRFRLRSLRTCEKAKISRPARLCLRLAFRPAGFSPGAPSFSPRGPLIYKCRPHPRARPRRNPALHRRNSSFDVDNPHLPIYGFGLSSVSTFFFFAKKPQLPKHRPENAYGYARGHRPIFVYFEVSGGVPLSVRAIVHAYCGNPTYDRGAQRPAIRRLGFQSYFARVFFTGPRWKDGRIIPPPSLCSFRYFPTAVRPTPHGPDTIFRIGPPGLAANHSRFFASGLPSHRIISRGCSTSRRPFSSRNPICLPGRLLPRRPPSLVALVARAIRRLFGGVFSGTE